MRLKRKYRISLAAILFITLIFAIVFLVDKLRYDMYVKSYNEAFVLEINDEKIEPTIVEGKSFLFNKQKEEELNIQVPKNSSVNLDGEYTLTNNDGEKLEGEVTYLKDGKYKLEVLKEEFKYVYVMNVDNDFSVAVDDTYAYSSGYLTLKFDDVNEGEDITIAPDFNTSKEFNFKTPEILVPIDYDTVPGVHKLNLSSSLSNIDMDINIKEYSYRESRFNVDSNVVEEASVAADDVVKNMYDKANLAITDEFYYVDGGFNSPSVGTTTGDFGDIRFINGDIEPTKIHYGVDYANVLNTNIYSTAKGKVSFVGFMPAYGNTVVVDHGNGITSHYFHLEQTYVKIGDEVDNKTVLGGMGTTGYSTGVHLHFEIHINGIVVNPYFFIQ